MSNSIVKIDVIVTLRSDERSVSKGDWCNVPFEASHLRVTDALLIHFK